MFAIAGITDLGHDELYAWRRFRWQVMVRVLTHRRCTSEVRYFWGWRWPVGAVTEVARRAVLDFIENRTLAVQVGSTLTPDSSSQVCPIRSLEVRNIAADTQHCSFGTHWSRITPSTCIVGLRAIPGVSAPTGTVLHQFVPCRSETIGSYGTLRFILRYLIRTNTSVIFTESESQRTFQIYANSGLQNVLVSVGMIWLISLS